MRLTDPRAPTPPIESAAKVRAERLCAGVLSVTISGPVTAALLLDIKREVMAEATADLRAFVVDCRRAIVAMDGDGLDAVLAGETPGQGAALPAAILASASYIDLFIGHARRMAYLGHSRRVFLAPAPALQWALEQGRQQGW